MKKLAVFLGALSLLWAYGPVIDMNPFSYGNQQLDIQRKQLQIQQQQLQMQQQQQYQQQLQQQQMQQQQLYQQQQQQLQMQQAQERQKNQYLIQQQDAKIKEYERIYKTERKEKQLDKCIENIGLIANSKKASAKPCFDYMDARK